ncbi:hypothetical protein WA026_017941 [Henosepilachna vigintioctopunctata]
MVSVATGQCGQNAVWSYAPNPCAPTCEFQHSYCSPSTMPRPQPGCQCRPGYIFANSDRKVCVKHNQCPKICIKPYFFWNDCGSKCPRTCQQKFPRPCQLICEPGCFCQEGFLLDTVNMECVPEENCPEY